MILRLGCLGHIVEDDSGGAIWGMGFSEYSGDEFKYEVPVRFEFMTLDDV